MTDKELLTLAAKAVGFNVKAVSVDIDDNFDGLVVGAKNTKQKVWWNPLSNDGDALRLAVDLGIGFMPDYEVGEANTCYMIGRCGYNTNEEFNTDPHAATRRAIVRAAAAIGAEL